MNFYSNNKFKENCSVSTITDHYRNKIIKINYSKMRFGDGGFLNPIIGKYKEALIPT